MIAYLNGKLTHAEPAYVIVECQGVGYLCRTSLNTYMAVKDRKELLLHTHLQIKEDAHTLYGFAEIAERELFLQLTGISGVGGATALMMLSGMSVAELQSTIRTGDAASLKRLKGVGEKTANRIILELQNKLPETSGATAGGSLRADALQALISLGLPKAEMEKRLDRILKEDKPDSVEQLIKLALKG